MARTKKKVDIPLLKRIIKEVEGAETFSNLNTFYQAVTDRYNGMLRDIKMGANINGKMVEDMFPEVTSSVIMLRIKEFGIRIKTTAGQRGRPTGTKSTNPVKRIPRAKKFQDNPAMVKSLELLKKELKNKPSWYHSIEGGSLIAAVKAYCYFCSGESTTE